MLSRVLRCLALPAFAVLISLAQSQPAPRAKDDAKPVDPFEIATSVTKGKLGSMAYTATAGQIPLRNETGEVECRMFYVAYTKDGANPSNRPITFAFNGGPGSSTIWLHMGSLGPMRAPMNDDGSLPRPPYEAVPNQDSWLDFTDLVMVDAPNTGYSRIAKPDLAGKFFGVRPDINAFADFVRNWLKEHQRWRSPIFIAGESYGGIRGSGLSNRLFENGIAINGFISISGTSNLITLDGMRGNDSTYVGFLPTMAATAWYHKQLSPRFKTVESVVQESTAWVEKEYGPAWMRGDSLSGKEKDQIATKLSEYIGLSKKYCLGSNLRVPEFSFFRELLREEGKTIGRLDARLTMPEEKQVGESPEDDPSSVAITAPYFTAFNDYADRVLGVKTQMRYNTYGNVRPWKEVEGSYSETSSDLRAVLAKNRYFRVLYCCGYYDLACPFYASIYTLNHMGLDKDSRARVSFEYYPAGHMMYIEKGSRKKFHDDVERFVSESLNAR